MSKLTTALWKGVKHGVTAGVSNTVVLIAAHEYNPKVLAGAFAVGFLAGIGINVHAIKGA